jgi:hypothetical protein
MRFFPPYLLCIGGSNEVEALYLLELEFQDENVEEDLDN